MTCTGTLGGHLRAGLEGAEIKVLSSLKISIPQPVIPPSWFYVFVSGKFSWSQESFVEMQILFDEIIP